MTFNRADFDKALKDIEDYLGYLKGNELAHGYLVRMWQSIDQQYAEKEGHPHGIALDWEYKFPCPDERFRVHPGVNWQPTVYTKPEHPVDWEAYVREVQHQTDLAYNQGLTWASGLAGYLSSICAQFVEPDVVTLRDSILDTHSRVVTPLVLEGPDNWAELGSLYTQWTGESATAFQTFYDNYNEVLALAGGYVHLTNIGASLATKVISEAQFGAMDYVTAMRDGLKTQLDQWVDRGWKPSDPSTAEFPTWVVNFLKVGDSALKVAGDYVPGLGDVVDVRDNLENIAGLVGDVADLAGVKLPEADHHVAVQDSDSIYTTLTNALENDYRKAFQDAMERLNGTGGDGGSIEEQAFSVPNVIKLFETATEDGGDLSLPRVSPVNLNGEGDDYTSGTG